VAGAVAGRTAGFEFIGDGSKGLAVWRVVVSLAIGHDICDDLTNGRKPGIHEPHAIEAAAKHLC